ncbi:hypothetical protein [Dactylosporangium darangshiense]|uniref:hypothetical protein n=1 Tax=Dactylosporangium darangshiense TaxID=579108 RepID=UPI00363C34D2
MKPTWVPRGTGVAAALVSANILYHIWVIDGSGRVRNDWTGVVLAVVVVTFTAAGLAILVGAYTAFFAPAERLKLWSWVSSGLVALAVGGFGLGWFYGLAVDA